MLLALLFDGRGFVVVFGAAAKLIGGEAFRRSIVHPAQAREVRHDRPLGAPLMGVMMMVRIAGVPVRHSNRVRRRVIVSRVSGANRERRHDSVAPGPSTRARRAHTSAQNSPSAMPSEGS